MSPDTDFKAYVDEQSEAHVDEHNNNTKKNEKIKQLREILGPKEHYGSSMGLAYDLQSERTRLKKDGFENDRPSEFTELEWKALSRTSRYPDNSTLAGARICKAYYEYYRTNKTLSELLKTDRNKCSNLKVNVQTIGKELYECDPDHLEFSILNQLLIEIHERYNSSKNDVHKMEEVKENGIAWAYNTFLNIHCVKETLNNKYVLEFLKLPNKYNLMKIVTASLAIHEKNEFQNNHFYEIDNFKRKNEDLYTSESQENDSEESEGNSEKCTKKPKRNELEFLDRIRECNFLCPGVPGKVCRLQGSLEKEEFDYDHIWPWKYSKDDSRRNKRPLCVSCHRWKTNKIDKYLKDDLEAIQMLQEHNTLPDRLMKLIAL